jgi:hypothetical protein
MAIMSGAVQCPFGARGQLESGHNYADELIKQSAGYMYGQEFVQKFFSFIDESSGNLIGKLSQNSNDKNFKVFEEKFEAKFFDLITNYIIGEVIELNPVINQFPEVMQSITLLSLKDHIQGNEKLIVELKIPIEFVAILGEGGLFDVTVKHLSSFLEFSIRRSVNVMELSKEVMNNLADDLFRSENDIYCPAKTLVRCAAVYIYLKYLASKNNMDFVFTYSKPLTVNNIIKQFQALEI